MKSIGRYLPVQYQRSMPEVTATRGALLILTSNSTAYRQRQPLKLKSKSKLKRMLALLSLVVYFAILYFAFFVWKMPAVMLLLCLYAFLPHLFELLTPTSAPTHIQIGPMGLRNLWLSILFGEKFVISGPLIPWEAINYVSACESDMYVEEQTIEINFSTANFAPLTKLSLYIHCGGSVVRYLDPRIWIGRFPSRLTLKLPTEIIQRSSDIEGIKRAFETSLPPEKLDPSLSSLGQSAEVPSYTTLWLETLSDTAKKLEPLKPGTVLSGPKGRYEILAIIGCGGQAVAYRADFVASTGGKSVQVALKEFVLPVSGGAQIVKKTTDRIRAEADLIRSLNHPSIVQCSDLFTSEKKIYLALDLIDGQSLKSIVQKEGPLAEDRVIELGLQMCELLAYLHSLTPPVVRRDFTPDNLLLRPDHTLVLIDFNVAKQMEADNATHTVVGKSCYIPAEQFRGSATSQSDIYALGCTLFWLLTGKDPEPISVSNPQWEFATISNELNAIVAKATAQKLADRFISAAEVSEALNTVKREATVNKA